MFKHRLKALRKAHNVTQKELSEAIGVVVSTVGKWEGKGSILPSDDIRQRIADFFGVSIDYLMGYDSTGNSGLSDDAFELGVVYDSLNRTGKQLLYDYAEMLVSKPAYREEASVESAM